MPLTIDTPMTIASAVSSARTLRPASPLSATRDHRRVDLLERLEDLVGAAARQVAHDLAVGEEQDAVGDRRRMRVVRDHHGRLAELVDGVAQQPEDLAARRRVEVAGRLVGEHHRRARDERAGDGDALLLAAGQLRRAVREPVGQADGGGDLLDPRLVGLDAGELERQDDVLGRRQHREQVEELEDEADVVAAQLRQRRIVEAADVDAGDSTSPDVGLSSPARMCISVDLPEPDGPMTAVRLAARRCRPTRRAGRRRRSRPRRSGVRRRGR